ncbi:hypothetical protein HMJ29_14190 [Hymenobacter taeanensis]|uniref:Uncharacterized protein n=1 Tax=Hymenobacter taeanensis TaxID=2735321 RepID=A0A6M6BLQ2_9BACT|nr:hypothetical protein [Hymenobacter taeanensis]QJX48025.1 hypothetical protein HMJ29_14190 [Hymenobacter taeanensis]
MESVIDTPKPSLYSARAIRIFSILFTPIAGGALLAQNFKVTGNREAARLALWGSIGGMLIILLIIAALPDLPGGSGLGLGIGLAGGLILNAYSDKILGSKEGYPTKKTWKPLLICSAVFIPIIFILLIPLFQE